MGGGCFWNSALEWVKIKVKVGKCFQKSAKEWVKDLIVYLKLYATFEK